MTTPPYLRKGDKIGIVSSAKRTSPDETAAAIALLESWGLAPIVAGSTYHEHNFFAGTDEQRTDALQQMLDDAAIKAIIFTKGAYGTLRIIDKLDFSNFTSSPKWIIGYSDITVLHSHIHNLGIKTLHAVMLQGIPRSKPEATLSMRQALFGHGLIYEIPAHDENRRAPESVTAPLVGGNLSMLHTLSGSDSDINTTGKILFIEDIDEYLYHLDRMMISLKRNGKLSGLKALVVGGMVEIKESTIPFGLTEYEIVKEHTNEYDYPVYFGFPAGHVADNRALIMGGNLTITPGEQLLKFEFSA